MSCVFCSYNLDDVRDECRWPDSYCFVGCCFQDAFNKACRILVQLLSSFFSVLLVSVQAVYPYSSMDMTAVGKKLRFILSDRSDNHMTDILSIAVHALSCHVLMSFSVDQGKVNLSSSFRERPICVEMSKLWFKCMFYVFSPFNWGL